MMAGYYPTTDGVGETVDVPIDPDNPKRYTVTSVASISRIRPYTSIARYSRTEKH